MRRALASLLPLLAACGGGESRPAPDLPVLRAVAVRPDGAPVVDGTMADDAWTRAPELTLELRGPGPTAVRLKAVHDGRRLYLLLLWPDPAASLNRYWEYTDTLEWRRFAREDGLSVLWSPGSTAARFREQGCALFCHGGRHVFPGEGSAFADAWYFGAQQTKIHPQARDLWLRQGEEHRLRGDNQPAHSDNLANVSDRYEGPRYFPVYRQRGDERVLFAKNAQEATPDWIAQHWTTEKNVGRQVPLDVLRPRGGSRGDVAQAARYLETGRTWVLELARDFDTGHPDDLPFGDPLVPALFAVAVNDDAEGPAHAVSGPVELRFDEAADPAR